MDNKGIADTGNLEFGGLNKQQEVNTFEHISQSDDGAGVREMDPNSLNVGLHRGLKDRRKPYIACIYRY